MKRFFAVLLISLVTLGILPQRPAEAAISSKYTLQVKLDVERGSLAVKENVVYANHTLANLTSIVFNVTPAHFNAFKLGSLAVDGQPATPKLDGVVLEVPLRKPLEIGGSAVLELDFTLELPRAGGRFGMLQKVMMLGNWYPVVAVYRDDWDRHRYSAFGDPFFTEVADYDVVIETSSPVTIAHTGDIVSRDGNTWRIRANRVRDFALTASERYVTKSATVDGTTITAFYLPEHEPAGSLYLEAATRSVRWFNKVLGQYPYRSLHIAEAVSGGEGMVGQEYANIVFISSSQSDKAGGMGSYLAYLVVHEVAHQWFYNLVGNDQLQDPWLDESLATFMAYQFLEWAPLALTSPSVSPSGSTPVNASLYDFDDERRYSATTYAKGAVFLQDLRAVLKEDAFYSFLKQYVENYKYKIATPRAFLTLAQEQTNNSLNPLVRKYFTYPEYKADKLPQLEVKWPSGDEWRGKVEIGLAFDEGAKQVVVEADGRWLYVSDSVAGPITIDTSRLGDDEYVVTVLVKDKDDRTVQRARRVKFANPKPLPASATAATGATSAPEVPSSEPASAGGQARPVETVERLSGGSPRLDYWLLGLVVVGLVGLGGSAYIVRQHRRAIVHRVAKAWQLGRAQGETVVWRFESLTRRRKAASVASGTLLPGRDTPDPAPVSEQPVAMQAVGEAEPTVSSQGCVTTDELEPGMGDALVTEAERVAEETSGSEGPPDEGGGTQPDDREPSPPDEAVLGQYSLSELAELESQGVEAAQTGRRSPSDEADGERRPTEGFPAEADTRA
ncbi:MAG: M1 family metallopeptidase [Chloroflexi bacterium]|nr:M1 family metallopeptidase [Chloroflexota bacterium]